MAKPPSLFSKEEAALNRATDVINLSCNRDAPLAEEYKCLLKDYKKLFKQTKFLVKMSDKQQNQLTLLTQKLQSANFQLEQKSELIRKIFGRYLSDEVVDTLLETDEGLSLGGERREITILTSDIRGFSARANRLPPEQVIKIINFYLEAMTETIAEYYGTLNEIMGDGILVYFGAPIIREDDPERAVACAVAMQLAMSEVNKQITAWGFSPLEMGIGVNTGEVVVGNIGSEKRTKYSAMGNEVNLTYRIESHTIGGQIFISQSTFQKVRHIVKIKSEQQVKLKGIKGPVSIYEVAGILGRYNLHCTADEKKVFLPLTEEIPIKYTILEGKHVSDRQSGGRLVKLSANGALIHCDEKEEFVPEILDNIKINLSLPRQSLAGEDIYAKVLSKTVDENNFHIRFTSISMESINHLITLCELDKIADLSVNHPIIDRQHQRLFVKIKELIAAISECREESIPQTIRFFEEDVVYHFNTEEKLMTESSYPDYADHKLQHTNFINFFHEFNQEYWQNENQNLHLNMKVQWKLIEFMIGHIIDYDKALGVFLNK